MHVLMTVNAAWNIVNFRMPLVAALIADGHRITVLAPPDQSVAALEAAGCRVLPLNMDVRGLNALRDLALLLRFRRIFQRERPDVVLGFTIKNNIFGALAAKSLRIPFIPNVTGLGTAFLSSGALQRVAVTLYRCAFRGVPAVMFQNEEDRNLFISRGIVAPGQTWMLPGSGIDLGAFPPAAPLQREPGEGPVFLMIARLLRIKGVYEYVEAARRLRQSHPSAKFRLIGPADSPSRTAITTAEVEGWVRDGLIDWLGPISDVRPHIVDADCVVLPSHGGEGTPRVLIEAGAMARPVIATLVPGSREVVIAEETGLLCPAADSTGLAAVCSRFAELSATKRADMGRAARQRIEEHYDVAFVVRAYRDVIALARPEPTANQPSPTGGGQDSAQNSGAGRT